MKLGLEEAQQLIALAEQQAEQYKKAITVAVVDSGGFLIALSRQNGARPLTPSIATSKAYTAAVMGRPANLLKPWAEHEPVFFAQVATLGQWPIVPADGAITIKKDGEILGGLGVSGGRPEEDHDIAEHALREAGYEFDFDAWAEKKV
jgi:uncharacterized protein GlcG (DUF336 family)